MSWRGGPTDGRHDSSGGSVYAIRRRPRERSTRPDLSAPAFLPGCAFVGAAVPHENARHEYLHDPDGQRRRLFKRGPIAHCAWVEQDEVGNITRGNSPALLPAQSIGGGGCHLPNRLRQGQPLLLPNESTEHARERAAAPRMTKTDAAVTRDHDPWLLVERTDVLIEHRLPDHARAAILHDSDEQLDWRDVLLACDRIERPHFVPGCASSRSIVTFAAPPTSSSALLTLAGSS